MAFTTGTGVNQILYVGVTNASPVSEGTGFSINVNPQFADDTSWGDTFQTQRPTINQATSQLNKHYDHSETVLQAAVLARTLLKFYWYPDRAETGDYWYWTGYLAGGGANAGTLTGMISQQFTIVFAEQPTQVQA